MAGKKHGTTVILCLSLLLGHPVNAQVAPPSEPMLVGLEYAVVDNDRLTASMASIFGDAGLTSMKLLGEASQWGRMQKRSQQAIDFSGTDRFVREYQRHGVSELVMALKSLSPWASVKSGWFGKQNPVPKPEHRQRYAKWVSAVVERYDHDGVDDMPGLQRPVRYFEIGSEFSSFEPEPVDEYLAMLAIAYRSAKQANANSVITHAAFLTTPVNLDVSDYATLEQLWRDTPMQDRHHDINDIRAVLDHPNLFDVVNVHNLGDPYEIEHIKQWLDHEMDLRGYDKPVIISDTIPTSYIAWGPATRCNKGAMGVLIPPATELDRCALAQYFLSLIHI